MLTSHSIKINLLIPLFIGLFLTACGVVGWERDQVRLPPSISEVTSEDSTSNGERIYFTASNERGEWISYTGGPDFNGMMMGSYLTCASCHGLGARGGLHVMHMQVMDSPDIRFAALSGESENHKEDEHGDEHGEYDLEDFRLAVIDGQHPDGKSLSQDMPRWLIAEEDLEDIFNFLKSIP